MHTVTVNAYYIISLTCIWVSQNFFYIHIFCCKTAKVNILVFRYSFMKNSA